MAAAGFHDWGKANDGFQKMLPGQVRTSSDMSTWAVFCWRWIP